VHAVPHVASLRSATDKADKTDKTDWADSPDGDAVAAEPIDVTTEIAGVAETGGRIVEAVGSVIDGKPDVIRLALAVMLAEGHLLIEDVPGVGKTMLAKALARSLGVQMRRIQFTPDLLPSDVTGVSVYDQARQEFEFRPGAVFANVVVGDEINRASPKTQSALLECMEERQVTVDGTTYLLPPPFMVIATQNPIEMEGTYPLPEAQRDRFTARVAMGYPSPAAELDMLASHGRHSPLDALVPVADADRDRPRRSRRRRGAAVRDRPRRGDPDPPGSSAGRLPPGRAAFAAHGSGDGGSGRSCVRRAGRRTGSRGTRARSSAAADRGGADLPAASGRRRARAGRAAAGVRSWRRLRQIGGCRPPQFAAAVAERLRAWQSFRSGTTSRPPRPVGLFGPR
jgi:hypothetical protein